MVKALSAKYYFITDDAKGKEVVKTRSISGLSINSADEDVIILGEAYGALKGENYFAVEKNITHIIK